MTRINLVPPSELADQHLFAEFREIKMVPKALARSITAHGLDEVLRQVPTEFVLGAGHVRFFYNKGAYLAARFEALRVELRRRGIQFNEASALDPDAVFSVDAVLRQDYTPTSAALALVRQRIAERIAARPHWYRYS